MLQVDKAHFFTQSSLCYFQRDVVLSCSCSLWPWHILIPTWLLCKLYHLIDDTSPSYVTFWQKIGKSYSSAKCACIPQCTNVTHFCRMMNIWSATIFLGSTLYKDLQAHTTSTSYIREACWRLHNYMIILAYPIAYTKMVPCELQSFVIISLFPPENILQYPYPLHCLCDNQASITHRHKLASNQE